MYRTKNITTTDIHYLLSDLRTEDRKECRISKGKKWKRKIVQELLSSDSPFLLAKTKKENIPVLIAGAWQISKKYPYIGCVWLLSTPEIKKHQITFIREMKKEIANYDEQFAILYNKIYTKNHLAKNWLKAVGFRFPNEETKLTQLDKAFLSIKVPKDFEIFYRERPVKGLGE